MMENIIEFFDGLSLGWYITGALFLMALILGRISVSYFIEFFFHEIK